MKSYIALEDKNVDRMTGRHVCLILPSKAKSYSLVVCILFSALLKWHRAYRNYSHHWNPSSRQHHRTVCVWGTVPLDNLHMNSLAHLPHHYSQQADCNETVMRCSLHPHSEDSGCWDKLEPHENIMFLFRIVTYTLTNVYLLRYSINSLFI